MRVVLQRVKQAAVLINNQTEKNIETGLVVFAGFCKNDNEQALKKIADKILALRIFSNDLGKFDFCLKDISGQLLIVSQFTLYANCAKGRRPDFLDAASYQEGKKLYEQFLDIIKTYKIKFETGEFGADMLVKIQNAGPVTIILDSDEI